MPDVAAAGVATISAGAMKRIGAVKQKARREVLIMASGPTMIEAPLAEARSQGAEIWGLNAVHRQVDPWLFTRFFQLHKPGSNEGHVDDPDHKAFLEAWGTNQYRDWVDTYGGGGPHLKSKGHKDPAVILTSGNRPKWPNSEPYPIDDVTESAGPMGRRYFTNTVDFMVALAIHEGFTKVSVYGADMISDGDSEYYKMRQSLEYYVGVMRGRGIDFYIPQRSALCKADRVYGYEEKPKHNDNLLKVLEGQVSELKRTIEEKEKERATAVAEINACKGGIRATELFIKTVKRRERGAQF